MATGDLLSFGPYLLDAHERRLTRNGDNVRIGSRHIQLLCYLVERAGQLIAKETLIEAIWADVAVTTGSLDQAIYLLRRTLPMPSGEACIETHTRRGIRFSAPVSKKARRQSDDSLDAILDAHRAWIEGRAALETLEHGAMCRARTAFERVVAQIPEQSSAHVGLANACALQFEMTRTDAEPDVAALKKAHQHALEARRLDPKYGEAWATLGFVLERISPFEFADGRVVGYVHGRGRDDALGAHRHSLVLEPDNWRHYLRLAACAWGEERLRAARRALSLMPGLAMAHVLAATVLIARNLLDDALEELAKATGDNYDSLVSPYGCPGAHWLTGLALLARGERDKALGAFRRELAREHDGHLYAKELAANTWYAIGAIHSRDGCNEDARQGLAQCLDRSPNHPFATAALGQSPARAGLAGADRAIANAIFSVRNDPQADCAATVEEAIAEAPSGSAGWLLPVEPVLRVASDLERWCNALARLRLRST